MNSPGFKQSDCTQVSWICGVDFRSGIMLDLKFRKQINSIDVDFSSLLGLQPGSKWISLWVALLLLSHRNIKKFTTHKLTIYISPNKWQTLRVAYVENYAKSTHSRTATIILISLYDFNDIDVATFHSELHYGWLGVNWIYIYAFMVCCRVIINFACLNFPRQ